MDKKFVPKIEKKIEQKPVGKIYNGKETISTGKPKKPLNGTENIFNGQIKM